jgi:hypothetical protein
MDVHVQVNMKINQQADRDRGRGAREVYVNVEESRKDF